MKRLFALTTACLLPLSTVLALPTNDNFANRITLSGDTPSGTDSNVTATTEPGEPSYSGTHTLWWTYRPSVTGRLTISTVGTNFSNHQVAVYLGASLVDLRLVAENDSSYQNSLSLSFPVTAGADYQISFGGTPGWTGTGTAVVSLALNKNADVSSLNVPLPATMSNDNFANRLLLTDASAAAIAYNISATTEPAEPSDSGTHTFWWTYRPTATGTLTISTQGTNFSDHQVAVYQGNDLVNLRLVADKSSSYQSSLSLAFPVTAGTDYHVSFGGTPGWAGTGSVVLAFALNKNAYVSSLNVATPATAMNDNFVNRVALPGDTITAIGYNPAATREAFEPNTSIGYTLWWSWTAGASGKVQLDFAGSDSAWLSTNGGRVAVLQGTSLSSLTSVTLTAVSSNAFSFSCTAGQTYQFQIGTNASSGSNYTGSIVMTVAGPPAPPTFSSVPSSQFVSLGSTLNLSGFATGGTVGFQWLKNGVILSGATTTSYHVASAGLANGGAYVLKATNKIGSTPSTVANIGVVNTGTNTVTVNEGAALKLTAQASGPAGMSYRWRYNGGDLSDSKIGTRIIGGSGTATLSISPVLSTDAGAYTCHLTMADPQNAGSLLAMDTGASNVTIRLKPVIDSGNAPSNAIVSGVFMWQPTASNSPTGFIITGLPTGSGLSYNPVTGALTGTPNTSGSFKIKVSAKNAAGAGPAQEFTLNIDALPGGATGSFTAWLSRRAQINGLLGGYLTLKVASTGTFTGTLKNGTATYNISGRVSAPPSGHPTSFVSIKRISPLLPLTLALDFDFGNSAVSGMLTDPGIAGDPGAVVIGRKLIWSGSTALAYAALYNSSVALPVGSENDVTQPLGAGWQQMTVTKAGSVTGTGRTAEGVSYTFSGSLWPDGSLPQFMLISSNKASVMGLPKITLGATVLDNRVSGWVDEYKSGPISSSDRTYASGIPCLDRVVDGAPWVKPTVAFPVVLNRADAPGNASIVFSKGDVESAAQFSSLAQTFRINKTNTTTFVATTAGNPCNMKMTITSSTGLFTGSFTLTDTVATKAVPRTVNYAGILLSHRNKGYGYFLLPELSPSTATSPILGGLVVLN